MVCKIAELTVFKITDKVKTGKGLRPVVIKELCDYYNPDSDNFVDEIEIFSNLYKITSTGIHMLEALESIKREKQTTRNYYSPGS